VAGVPTAGSTVLLLGVQTTTVAPFQFLPRRPGRQAIPGPDGSFEFAGVPPGTLPGFQFIQDPIEYNTRTHHMNQDTFERLLSEDLIKNAAIVASFAYLAANRDNRCRANHCRVRSGRPDRRCHETIRDCPRLWIFKKQTMVVSIRFHLT
jgi:hypothetical protein